MAKKIGAIIISLMFFACGTLGLAEGNGANAAAFTEDMGSALAEKLRVTVFPFDEQLTDEERALYYHMLSDHLQNLSASDDWQAFARGLDECETLDDLRNLMKGTYIGITEAEPGRLSREEIIPLANAILEAANLSEEYSYRFYGPLHAASSMTEAWNILAKPHSTGAYERELRMFLTTEGKILSLDVSKGEDLEIDREMTSEEKQRVRESAEAFSLAYSAFESSSVQPILGVQSTHHYEGLSEPVAHIWAFRGYDLDGEVFGDLLIIGVTTGTIYGFKAYVAEPTRMTITP